MYVACAANIFPFLKLELDDEQYTEAVMELLVGNPVHVYTLLDRLVRGLPGLLAGVSSQLGERINLVTGAGHLAQLGLGDVEAAGQALVRVQFAYRCPVSAPPLLTSCRVQAGPGGPG